MNCVRKHLSAIKGGRLAAAAFPARLVNLIISDVPGDDPAAIASGPTVADPTTSIEGLEIVRRHGLKLPLPVMRVLESGQNETPKPGDARLARVETRIIASPQQSLEAAAAVARASGFAPVILGGSIEAEARELGFAMAGIAKQVRSFCQPAAAPCVIISGGETTVTVRGKGFGGRNVEFLLALALKLDGAAGISALAADTDGVDGSRDIAGAMIFPDTMERARTAGIDAWAMLENNDAHSFFGALGNQVATGPTLTNVNDFRAILIS
jgi:hydroxypyruvate reductase